LNYWRVSFETGWTSRKRGSIQRQQHRRAKSDRSFPTNDSKDLIESKSMRSPRTIYLLRQTQLLAYAHMVERLKELDLTPAQYLVLSLSAKENGLSSAELARRSQITAQSMNEIIAALHRKGLMKRRENPENRRVLRLGLTREGTRLLAESDRRIDRMEADIFRCLAAKDLTAFRSLHLKILRANLDQGSGTLHMEKRPSPRVPRFKAGSPRRLRSDRRGAASTAG
jgi:DNA-binding MarR family transcriptional regulator